MNPSSSPLQHAVRVALLRPALRGPFFQPLWSRLHRLSLWGMNAGPGGSLSASGEAWALAWCAARTPADRPFVLFDAGANEGGYAVDARRLLGGRLQTHCFEPSPQSFRKLQANLGDCPSSRLQPFGLTDTERTATLFSHPGGSREASLVKRDLAHWGLEQSGTETVRLRRLDEYCREAGVDRIDLLKLDVEGHEAAALRGAGAMLAEKRIRHIQFEFGAPDIESRTFFKDLYRMLDPHYRLYRIVYQGLAGIPDYSEFHENFVTTNFLAVAR